MQAVQTLSETPRDTAARSTSLRPAILLALCAIAIYAPLIGWGLPHATAPDRTKTFATDEILPLEGLAEMHNTFVVSRPDRNYGYPWWHYFVVSAAQAPYIGYLKLTGGLQHTSPDFPFGFQDPVRALEVLTLIGRFVSVLMGAGIVIAAYLFGKTLWGELAGRITAALTLLNYLMIYFSRTGNMDVPAFFWTSLAAVIVAKIMVDGFTLHRAVWLGLLVGLAIATKDQAVFFFAPFAGVLLLPVFNRKEKGTYTWKPALTALGVSIAAYLVGTGMIVDPARQITRVKYIFFAPEKLCLAEVYLRGFPKTLAGVGGLALDFTRGLIDVLSLPVFLLAIIGVILLAYSRPRLLWLALPVATLFPMFLSLPELVIRVRYLLPLVLIINGFAAYALISLRQRQKHLWILTLFLALGWQFILGADLTYAEYRDTRYDAARWMKANLTPADRIEYFGVTHVLPPLPAELHTRRIAGREKWVGELGHGESVLQYLARNGPDYIVSIPDWTSHAGMDHSADCPPEVYAALTDGSAGYVEVASFPGRTLLPSSVHHPEIGYPAASSICPPVKIFCRREIAARLQSKWQRERNE